MNIEIESGRDCKGERKGKRGERKGKRGRANEKERHSSLAFR